MRPRASDEIETLIRQVISAFYYVYSRLGYGFREKLYTNALARVLMRRGFDVKLEVPIRVMFEGECVGLDLADMSVNGVLIIENKAGRKLDPNAPDQLFNYLRGSVLEDGLLFFYGPKPWFYRAHASNARD